MGMFQVSVDVTNPNARQQRFQEQFWVDTGALYTFVPETRLQEIGLEPVGTRDMVMADGRQKKMLLGEALFSLEGSDESLTCPVIFGPPDSLYLLGATALETFGLDVDPAGKRLKPILGIIGGHLASK